MRFRRFTGHRITKGAHQHRRWRRYVDRPFVSLARILGAQSPIRDSAAEREREGPRAFNQFNYSAETAYAKAGSRARRHTQAARNETIARVTCLS